MVIGCGPTVLINDGEVGDRWLGMVSRILYLQQELIAVSGMVTESGAVERLNQIKAGQLWEGYGVSLGMSVNDCGHK